MALKMFMKRELVRCPFGEAQHLGTERRFLHVAGRRGDRRVVSQLGIFASDREVGRRHTSQIARTLFQGHFSFLGARGSFARVTNQSPPARYPSPSLAEMTPAGSRPLARKSNQSPARHPASFGTNFAGSVEASSMLAAIFRIMILSLPPISVSEPPCCYSPALNPSALSSTRDIEGSPDPKAFTVTPEGP
uniref:Uncharacterized protein n=1 Tax=Sphaerodactylus townsendi TaxID=933632 RepID=A0ACB8G7W8_9SAUR